MTTQPDIASPPAAVRFAAVGDLHCRVGSRGAFRELFTEASRAADVLLLCGDLTDYGLPEEARLLADELTAARIPVVGVLGNHDFESGAEAEVRRILMEAGMQLLDGETCTVDGVDVAGIKGFAGGFGTAALGPWGERTNKLFVQEALDEALKLENALARLRSPRRVAVLHYAPLAATVQGEPAEIFPFLGSSRLAEPLIRYPVDFVVHGHAHRGQPEGRLVDGTPVYNVAMPLLKQLFPDRAPFRLLHAEPRTVEA